MKRISLIICFAIFVSNIHSQTHSAIGCSENTIHSPTEGNIGKNFIPETAFKNELLQMLADFMPYVKTSFISLNEKNAAGEKMGYFKGENSGGSNERGVRHNADLSMICAFLYKYGRGKVNLPEDISWNNISNMANKSLIYAYSTHKANKLKLATDNKYWGSTDSTDFVWESSLWAMSVACSAFFQYDSLSVGQKNCIYNLVKAECNYELNRSIPTGFEGDSKAEENGWETNILACALGLYPNDELAPLWFDRLRAFAVNCYSHTDDARNQTVIDPSYDHKTIKDYYLGNNLYDDYTLQNHNYFHTSYQNVVIQELGESYLLLKLFQNSLNGSEKWKTNALMHNNHEVMEAVLSQLALADGELAMPNGNDWSLYLYDQITSYSTLACFLRNPDALMFENLALKQIKARQSTTTDGSWLLRPDAGARRMGVQAHRLMMTWMMHHLASTESITPSSYSAFRSRQAEAKLFKSQDIVRASTRYRFSIFSWSEGLKSYTGYFCPNNPDFCKIVVPFKAHNTGNITGWYTVKGKAVNAFPMIKANYLLIDSAYSMNGVLATNDSALTQHFALYSGPGNVILYTDYVTANCDLTITGSRGGLLAISTDELTKLKRTLYSGNGCIQSDGSEPVLFTSPWVNIDNQIGVVTPGSSTMAFADRANNNSILTSKLYPFYSNAHRNVSRSELVDARQLLYYCSVDAKLTNRLADVAVVLRNFLPRGWNGLVATDSDNSRYYLISNFAGQDSACIRHFSLPEGAPVFKVPTHIYNGNSTATFYLQPSHSIAGPLQVFIVSGNITAIQTDNGPETILTNNSNTKQKVHVRFLIDGNIINRWLTISAHNRILVTLTGSKLVLKLLPKD